MLTSCAAVFAQIKDRGVELLRPVKGTLALRISIPEGNLFHVHQGGNTFGNSAGFLGIAGGMDYFLSSRFCVNADIGALTDFLSPIPVPISYGGPHKHTTAQYADLQLGTTLRNFRVDIGLQVNRSGYFHGDEGRDTVAYSSRHANAGLALSTQYQIRKWFHVAANYYPSFSLELRNRYSHLLFFELGFRIPVFTPGRKKTIGS